MTWVMLRRAMQTVGDVMRREVFDRIEGGQGKRLLERQEDRLRLSPTISPNFPPKRFD